MSCFAVSRLLKHKEDSPPLSAQQQQQPPPLSSGGGPEGGGGGGFLVNTKNGHFRSRKANNSLPNVEIVQEMPRESSMTPVPPSSPQHQHQYQYQYHHQQYPPRHMSPHRSCGGSVPPSPALSGCRSPSRQRNTPTYSTLEVQSAALAAMKDEMLELASRLTRVSKERDYMEKALNRLQLEKLRLAKEKDDQLDCTTARYEERLVELHSVIAELSRQLEEKSRDQINEEESGDDDEEEDEEDETEKNEAVESRTSTEVNDRALEAGQHLAHQLEVGASGSDLCAFLRMSRSTASQSMHNSSTTSLQYLALQEELSDAKERNVQLAARLQQKEADLDEARKDLEEVAKEKEQLREKVTQLEEKILMAPAMSPVRKKHESGPDFKKAEKKKIKKIEEDEDTDEDGNFGNHQKVTGSELTSVRNSVVVEHLVQDIQDKSSMQEFRISGFIPEQKRKSAVLESKLQEFEIEMERLGSRIEHLKSQNEVLSLTLTESKNHCDNLTVLIGKYESNHTVQALVISHLDHMMASYEALLELVQDPNLERSKAQKVIRTLDTFLRPDSGLALPSSSLESGSWEQDDSSGYSQNSSIGSSGGVLTTSIVFKNDPIENNMDTEEIRLRDIINQLKSLKSSIQATIIQELETHHPEHDLKPNESKTADLELAVLVQELMAMREEKADLRAQVHLLEKEKKSLELIISSQQAQEHALKTHIQHLQDELENQESMTDMESASSIMDRKEEMKSRITELLTTLEKVKRNSELRQQQSDDLIQDLKKSNESLNESLEKTKKKYEFRIKSLEQQILQTLIQGDTETTTATRPLITFPTDYSNKSDSD